MQQEFTVAFSTFVWPLGLTRLTLMELLTKQLPVGSNSITSVSVIVCKQESYRNVQISKSITDS
jgi:hypothetical protein